MTIVYKPQPKYPAPDDAAELTAEEVILRDTREEIVLRWVREQLRDPALGIASGLDLYRTGNIQRARVMMIGKIALVHDGHALLDHWGHVGPELSMAWSLHAAHIDENRWNEKLTAMGRVFHTTNTSADGWQPVAQNQMPFITDVKPFDVLRACGLIGGKHPAEDHI